MNLIEIFFNGTVLNTRLGLGTVRVQYGVCKTLAEIPESRRIKRRFLVETGPRAARQGRAASGYAELAGLLGAYARPELKQKGLISMGFLTLWADSRSGGGQNPLEGGGQRVRAGY